MADAGKLKTLAAKVVVPAHVCRRNETAANARECAMRPLDGASFVRMLQRWVALSHITVEEGGDKALNVTQLMESYASQFDVWMRWRCGVQGPRLCSGHVPCHADDLCHAGRRPSC